MFSGAWDGWARECRFTVWPIRSFARRPPSAGRGPAGSRVRRRPGDRRRHLRAGATGEGRQRPRRAISSDSLRETVISRLTDLGADEETLEPVREYHELESAQQVQALGDSLPIGLRLVAREPSDRAVRSIAMIVQNLR